MQLFSYQRPMHTIRLDFWIVFEFLLLHRVSLSPIARVCVHGVCVCVLHFITESGTVNCDFGQIDICGYRDQSVGEVGWTRAAMDG